MSRAGQVATVAAAFSMAVAGAAAAPGAATVPELTPTYALVLLVNQWDGGQTETVLARGMPATECLPMMQAIWRANGDAPLVGMDEFGPIPAFDAACLPD